MKNAVYIILSILLIGCMDIEYIKFRPVVLRQDQLVILETLPDSLFYDRLKEVLIFYKEPYKQNDRNEILVPVKLWRDVDLMWNYTSKANDSTWLNEH